MDFQAQLRGYQLLKHEQLTIIDQLTEAKLGSTRIGLFELMIFN